MLKRNILLASLVFLAACGSDDKPPLKGDRISVLELQRTLEPDARAENAAEFSLPAAWHNEFWPQNGGYPNHAMQHLALNEGQFKEAWSVSIGQGSTDELPLVAQPIVVDGRIFTLDTESQLTAHSTGKGRQFWTRNIRDKDEDDAVIGGGIAFSNAVLYATNGYDELLAVNAENGEIFWRIDLPAPSRAAPTVLDNRVFVTTLDSRLLALDAMSGDLLWEYVGIGETAGLVGAASAAANFDVVVPVFSSGEVTALRVENGSTAWSDNLSSVRVGGGLASLSDIRALPVMDKGLVIAINFGGRIVAIDERTGVRVWQREFGGSQTPWVAGDYIFVISSDNELVALNRNNGQILWVTQLDKSNDGDKVQWTGPVLSGGRLIMAGSDGRILEAVPETGQLIAQSKLGKSFEIAPLVADKTLYLLAEDGTLLALR